jgi:hypothetical protein
MRLDTYLNAMCRAFAIVVVIKRGSKKLIRDDDIYLYDRKKRQFHAFRNRIIRDFLNLQAEVDSESRWAHYYFKLLEDAEVELD